MTDEGPFNQSQALGPKRNSDGRVQKKLSEKESPFFILRASASDKVRMGRKPLASMAEERAPSVTSAFSSHDSDTLLFVRGFYCFIYFSFKSVFCYFLVNSRFLLF